MLEAEVLADGVFAGLEEALDEGFVDDDDVLGGGGVVFGEGAAADDVLAHGLQVAWGNVIPGRADGVVHAGHAVALADDELPPVIGEGGVLGEGGALDAGNVGEAILQLAVQGVELGHGVRGPRGDEADGDAVVDVVAEVLVLEVGERAGEQASTGEQDDGEGGLDDDQRFLRPGCVVAGAAIGAAKSFDGIGAGGEPRGGGSEDGTGDEREDEGEGKDGERGRGGDGHELRAVESEGDDSFDAEVGDDESGDAAEDRKQDAFGEGLADDASA